MADTAAFKQALKDASDEEAEEMYKWATACMEVRGLVKIEGTRKRRSDAGQPRTTNAAGDQLTLREPGQ